MVGIEGDSNPDPAAPLVRPSGDGYQVRFHGPCAALHFDCPTYRYSTSAIPVYYSLRPMVTGTTVYPLMICYSVFDVCCGDRPMYPLLLASPSFSQFLPLFFPLVSFNPPLAPACYTVRTRIHRVLSLLIFFRGSMYY